jgi:exodeoxyribonuclease-3
VRGNDKPSDHAPVSVDLDWPPSDDDEDGHNENDDLLF